MFKPSGTILAFAPSGAYARAGAGIEVMEQQRTEPRFTPLLSRRDTWLALKRKSVEARSFSAICLPGWDRG